MKKNEQKLRFALFGNEFQIKKTASIQKVLSYLSERDADVFIDRPFYDFLEREQLLDVPVAGILDSDDFMVDYVISMGGDGTFLKTASRVGAKGIPMMGVNTGRLGFLADVTPDSISHALDHIYRDDYDVEEHSLLEIKTVGGTIEGCPYALNDIAILKRDNAAMISIHAKINGEDVVTYQADGLIVSTPTGSTAYNLSNGGPIIAPATHTFCLTPVASHSLNSRPLVISDDCVISLKVESRSHNYLVAIDGRSEKMAETIEVTIQKASHTMKIIKRHPHSYFPTLREKMMWGADMRDN